MTQTINESRKTPNCFAKTTLADVRAHVEAEQAKFQAELDALYARNRELSWVDEKEFEEFRLNQFSIEKVHGKVLALAGLAGYLEGRIWVDENFAQSQDWNRI